MFDSEQMSRRIDSFVEGVQIRTHLCLGSKVNPSGLLMFCLNGTQQQVYKRIKVNKNLKEAANNNKNNNCKTTAEKYEPSVK